MGREAGRQKRRRHRLGTEGADDPPSRDSRAHTSCCGGQSPPAGGPPAPTGSTVTSRSPGRRLQLKETYNGQAQTPGPLQGGSGKGLIDGAAGSGASEQPQGEDTGRPRDGRCLVAASPRATRSSERRLLSRRHPLGRRRQWPPEGLLGAGGSRGRKITVGSPSCSEFLLSCRNGKSTVSKYFN